MSRSLDPDQARNSFGPDLGPNYLQRLSADDTSKQRVKMWHKQEMYRVANLPEPALLSMGGDED